MKSKTMQPRELPTAEQLTAELGREKYKRRYKRVLRSTIYTLIVVAAVAVLVATIWMPVLQIYGASMAPTLDEGDKVQAEQERLEAVTGLVAQAEQTLEDTQAAADRQKKRLAVLQKETKTAKTAALTIQDIEAMGKKNALTGNISLTPQECDTLKQHAINGIAARADNRRLKEKLASAEQSATIWKQRFEALNEKYQELKKKAQPDVCGL